MVIKEALHVLGLKGFAWVSREVSRGFNSSTFCIDGLNLFHEGSNMFAKCVGTHNEGRCSNDD